MSEKEVSKIPSVFASQIVNSFKVAQEQGLDDTFEAYYKHIMAVGDIKVEPKERERVAELQEGVDRYMEESQGGVLYSFAGERANLDKKQKTSLDEGKSLEGGLLSAEEIRQATGWFRGIDNKWRLEINDKDASINSDKIRNIGDKQGKLLGFLFEHDKLFKAYPVLKTTIVVYRSDFEQIAGASTLEDGTPYIVIGKAFKKQSDIEQKKSILHELQHLIQFKEGFAVGSTFKETKSNDLAEKIKNFNNYFNSAGEIEAKDVENRSELTDEERRLVRPDIDRAEAIVEFEDGRKVAYNADFVGQDLVIDSIVEMEGLTEDDFKNKMLNTLKGFKNQKIYNDSLGADIEIRTSSIKKYKSFFADKNKRLVVPYIPEMLRRAEFNITEDSYMQEKEKNIKAYYKADLPITIDNEGFDVHITVKEDDKGNFFWDAQVEEKDRRTVSATNPSVGGLSNLNITPSGENVNSKLYQKAYAGSRVDYDRPSLEAIGSGEGAQVHGWGLYYALNKDVAEGYRETFTQDKFVLKYGDKTYTKEDGAMFDALSDAWFAGSKEDAIDGLQTRLDLKQYEDLDERDDIKNAIDFLKKVDANKIELAPQGQVHEVDIPENPYLLDEQKTFNEQSEYVKERLVEVMEGLRQPNFKEKIFENKEEAYDFFDKKLEEYKSKGDGFERFHPKEFTTENGEYGVKYVDDYTVIENFLENGNILGGGIYDRIVQIVGSKKQASQLLEIYGIKGITYEGRHDGRAFVIFNPDDVKVLEKFYSQTEGDILGSYDIAKREVELFKGHNPSTLTHELGHHFIISHLNFMESIGANDKNKPVFEFLSGLANREINSVRDMEIADHENLIEAFIDYMNIGQAPNIVTGNIFKRAKMVLKFVKSGVEMVGFFYKKKYCQRAKNVVYMFL